MPVCLSPRHAARLVQARDQLRRAAAVLRPGSPTDRQLAALALQAAELVDTGRLLLLGRQPAVCERLQQPLLELVLWMLCLCEEPARPLAPEALPVQAARMQQHRRALQPLLSEREAGDVASASFEALHALSGLALRTLAERPGSRPAEARTRRLS